MPKWLKIVLITFLSVIVIVTACAFYIYHNLDQLKQYALKEVNKQLKAELSAGSIDVTFWHTFPNVSLAFNDISINDPIRKNKKLLDAKHLFLGFNFYDILNKKYQIHLLQLDNGILHLFVDAANRANYDIIREEPQETAKKKSPFSFELNRLEFHKIHLVYHNISQQLNIETDVDNTSLSGSFTDDQFELATHLEAAVKHIESEEIAFFTDKKIVLTTSLLVNMKEQLITIGKSECMVDALALQLAGKIKQAAKKTDLDIRFSAREITIQSLLSIMPFKLPEAINTYKSEGKVYFRGIVKGVKSVKEMPAIKIDFGIENGSLLDPDTKVKLEQISLHGEYSNGAGRSMASSVLSLSKIEANLQKQKLHGSLKFQNFEKPLFSMELSGGADMDILSRFLKIAAIEEAVGDLQFSLSLKGERKGEIWDWSNPFNVGLFKANLSTLKLRDFEKPFTSCSLDAKLTNNLLSIEQVLLSVNKTSVTAKGDIAQFMDYLIGSHHELKGDFSITSASVDLEDVLIYSSKAEADTGTNSFGYAFSFDVTALALKHKNFFAGNVKVKATLEPGQLRLEKVEMISNGGSVSAKGTVFLEEKSTTLKTQTTLAGININELLKQFDNFGQSSITSKNLSGTLTTEAELVIVWNEKLDLVQDKLLMVADITIKNGQLINYEPLNSLGRFVDVNELNNLKFSDLKNTITIKSKILNIPVMDIKNNALNLTLSGTHTFENYLDYKIKLSLSELLSKNRKPQPNEFGEEDEKTNRLNLFITIKGPINDLKYSYDKKAVKTKIKQDIKAEKENIKEILRTEFGIKRDSTFKKIEKKHDKDDELEFEPE